MVEFFEFMNKILGRQKEFQRLYGIDLDTVDQRQKNLLAEAYLYRAAEEVFELRRTQPEGVLGRKTKQCENRRVMIHELIDILLFLANFQLTREITWEEIIEELPQVQRNNFEKRLQQLREEQQERETNVNKILQEQ